MVLLHVMYVQELALICVCCNFAGYVCCVLCQCTILVETNHMMMQVVPIMAVWVILAM
jgi:hypothetical protein